MRGRPIEHKRPTRKHQEHDRLLSRNTRFEQLLLVTRQIQMRARSCLAPHRARFTQRENCHIRAASRLYRLGEARVRAARYLRAFRVNKASMSPRVLFQRCPECHHIPEVVRS